MPASPAGTWLARNAGHHTFEPAPLPPPTLQLSSQTLRRLSQADYELGLLQGSMQSQDDAADLRRLACLREAVASCRLDGSPVTLRDLLWWDVDGSAADRLSCSRGDVRIAANYAALLDRDAPEEAQPLLRRSLTDLHIDLYRGVRGREERPGRLRSSEIWLGPQGSTLQTALYVPPAPEHIERHLAQLLRFSVEEVPLPPLARLALIAYQLESIHPFVDGNGRVTRLTGLRLLGQTHGAVTRWLCPSEHGSTNIGGHFRQLQSVRKQGDFDAWISYSADLFVAAARRQANHWQAAAQHLAQQRALVRREEPTLVRPALRLLHHLVRQPLLSVGQVAEVCGRTYANANVLVSRLQGLGILREITGRRRHRRYLHELLPDA